MNMCAVTEQFLKYIATFKKDRVQRMARMLWKHTWELSKVAVSGKGGQEEHGKQFSVINFIVLELFP